MNAYNNKQHTNEEITNNIQYSNNKHTNKAKTTHILVVVEGLVEDGVDVDGILVHHHSSHLAHRSVQQPAVTSHGHTLHHYQPQTTNQKQPLPITTSHQHQHSAPFLFVEGALFELLRQRTGVLEGTHLRDALVSYPCGSGGSVKSHS